ncbi:hypothetical protein H3Z85_11545 [Chryseobacterium indologenes]|nr:hypothetical protein H3Z85_11545 [Chryseobacterium indologenes]
MSIQLSGPKGYEYQYRVTVLNALFLRNNSTKMYVEKIGSEDALIEIENEDSTKQFIEIQVKREEGILGIPQLIKWLCHFEERTSNNNLLQKLIDNENTKVIFVTRSRCSDSIVSLKKDYNKINDSAAVLTSKELSSFFLKELKKIKIGDTDLNKKREQFCYNQALKLNHKMVKDLLEKCIIVEEFTDEKVDTAVLQYLNSKCQIAQSKTEEIYLKLIQVVLGGRDEGFDISKRIKELLELNKIGNPFVDPLYKTRNEEKSLLLKLEKDHVLLLTGTSLCGKTELAKKISESFVLKGYNYFIHDEIYNIKKFLQTNILDNKIVILSDPFGHVELKDKFTEILKSIKELLDIKEKHHLLIITSRIELLFDVYNTKTIEECSIGKMQWFDLTLHDIETLLPFWEFISKENSLTKNIFETVEKGIIESQNESQLQIGQLRYLASEDIEKLEGKNFSELVHIAKSNSREIANQLETSNLSSAQLLSILSVSSSSVYGVDFKDLAYIYSSDTELPSSLGEDVYIHSLDENESDFPSYSENFTPSIQLKKDLGYLEKRNLISIKKQIVITTHSNFLSAGLNLFLDKSTIYLEEKLDLYKKSIFCLNEQTAFIASRNLFFIYNQINPEFRSQVIELGFKALNSIFPAVEDNSLLFLTKIIGDLNIEQQEKIIFKIQKGGTDYYDIEWYNNQIPFKTNGGAGMKNLSLSLDKSKVSEVENKLKQKEFPSSYEIWGYIKTQKGKNTIDKEIFVILLQVKEAFIRSEIIYEIFRNQNILDEKFIEFLFKDEHPTVIFNLISAVIQNWFNFSEELKVICNSLIVKSLNRTDVAIRAYEVIATFSIDYGSESIIKWKKFNQKQIVELWNLWGVIYPQIINNIPLKIYLNGARFSSTMSTATKYIDIKIGMEVLNAWYKRIDFQISKNKIIDEYEMSIMEDLLALTKNNSEIRKNLFSNLINYYDTSFLLSNLKWVLNNWEYIVQLEKEQIFTILDGNRMDLRWIKAVILTTENPPKELTEKF